MNKINPMPGGDYPEAVEIGLWHANQEHKNERISQVILIGDASAKSKKSIINFRNKYGGESYWKTSKFGDLTHYKDEVQKLKCSGIQVHAFYLNNEAKRNFEEIAKETNGFCQFLDIDTSAGSEILANTVTECILKSVGKDNGVNGE